MPIIHDDAFRAWEACAPARMQAAPVWRFHAYRVALYLLDLAASDARGLRGRTPDDRADRLLNAVTSLCTSVERAFERSRHADRSRRIDTALRSLRDSANRYGDVQAGLPHGVAELRYDQLSQLRRILVGSQKWLASDRERVRLPSTL